MEKNEQFVKMAAHEILTRAARRDLLVFARVMNSRFDAQPFHRVYYEVLRRFAFGEIRKLIVSMPPQHGKSEGSSRMLPAFLLGTNPDLRVVIGSYNATVARDFNRDVQRIIDTDAYREIFPKTSINGRRSVTMQTWLRNSDVVEVVGRKGSLRVVGRGGPLTSKTVDVSILDDVYKDYEEASSPIVREAAWKWYTTVVRTRLHNDSRELIVFTRWHEEDIIGRLYKKGGRFVELGKMDDLGKVGRDDWCVLNFPALKVGGPTDMDGRGEGEALWEARHSRRKLEAQRSLDPVMFQALYQGDPASAEGRLYGPFRTWVRGDDWGTLVRVGAYVDVADAGGDFLFAAAYEVRKAKELVYNEQTKKMEALMNVLITDMEMTDAGTEVTTETVPQLINRNGVQKAWIEANGGGAGFGKMVMRKVAARVELFTQHGNKEARVLANAATVNNRIIMPFGWETRFPQVYAHLRDFLRDFKANAHDDPEDALTGIVEKEILGGDSRPYSMAVRGVRKKN